MGVQALLSYLINIEYIMVCTLHGIVLHTCTHKKGSPVSFLVKDPWFTSLESTVREIQLIVNTSCLGFFSPVEQVRML